jgi:hypothetical protein
MSDVRDPPAGAVVVAGDAAKLMVRPNSANRATWALDVATGILLPGAPLTRTRAVFARWSIVRLQPPTEELTSFHAAEQ